MHGIKRHPEYQRLSCGRNFHAHGVQSSNCSESAALQQMQGTGERDHAARRLAK